MPMGLVSNEEFEKQLSNTTTSKPELDSTKLDSTKLREAEIIDLPSKGRKEGDNNVPETLRNIIGATAAECGRQEALSLARMFNVSESSVSAYTKGATSTASYDQSKPSLVNFINQRKQRMTKKALLKMGNAMDEITPEKLILTSAKDLASIAKDMGAIVRNMEPELDSSKHNSVPSVQFMVYAPQIKSEESYDVITVQE